MIEEIKSFISLDDGDVIMSGTPKGVATYKVGDRFVGKIYAHEKLLLEHVWVVV